MQKEEKLNSFIYLNQIQLLKPMNVPVYDFPNSPILLLGFFGILIALTTLFIANNKYFNSPLNRDKKFVKNSLEIEFKKVSSQLSWDGCYFNWTL